jgi:hypothetical protein
MPIVPIRGLGKYGVITDVDPYDLPPEAWSFAVNVRFSEGRVDRAPVFRKAAELADSDPRFVSSTTPSSGFDAVLICYLNGRVSQWVSGVETDLSIDDYVETEAETPFSVVSLSNVLYVNRSDRAPWSKGPSDAKFSGLANWPDGVTANLLRACGGALVALGITDSGTSYPTMVRTSEFVEAGQVPASWDYTDPETNATRNVLAEMKGPIVDAANLGDALYIYGTNETWLMQPDGSFNVFSFRQVFQGYGAINANCAVEVDGRHYVFGTNDIWMHDGQQPVSIADGRVRKFVFRTMNISKARRFFVRHNPLLKEIYFCYVSGDLEAKFITGEGCNRCAVFNYSTPAGTWSFYDLPSVFSAGLANLDTVLTYETATQSYANIGGTYLDQEDSLKKTVVMVGEGIAADDLSTALYAFDLEGEGSTVAFPVDTAATKGWVMYRDGIDLDELGAELRGYKLLTSVYPQGRLAADAQPIEFTFGAADYFNVPPTFPAYQTYDGQELYKLDYMTAGRYLSMRVRHNDYRSVSLSGLDLDIEITADR